MFSSFYNTELENEELDKDEGKTGYYEGSQVGSESQSDVEDQELEREINESKENEETIAFINTDAILESSEINEASSDRELMEELSNQIDTHGVPDDFEFEVEEEIVAFINSMKPSDYDKYEDHPTIGQHELFIEKYENYYNERDNINFLISESYDHYKHTGIFLSDLWDIESKGLHNSWKDIETIIVYYSQIESETVICDAENIEHFMESFMVPKYKKGSIFSTWMFGDKIEWDYEITVYTKDFIYYSWGYNSDYEDREKDRLRLDVSEEGLRNEYANRNIIETPTFYVTRRNPIQV